MSYYSDLILADAPVAYYRLTAGSNADSSGNSRTISWVDAPSSTSGAIAGDADTAADFDGSADYGTTSDSDVFSIVPTRTTFTAELWANPDTNTVGVLLQKNQEWQIGYGEGGSTNQFFCNMFDASYNQCKYTIETGTSPTGSWYHIVMVYNGTNLKLYKNGTAVGSYSVNNSVSGITNTTNGLRLGNRGFDNGQKYNGKMDEVAIYNTVLSDAQILAHYNAGIGHRTVTISNIPNVTVTGHAPTILVVSPADSTQTQDGTPNITFTAHQATANVITASTATIMFTGHDANVIPYTSFSYTAYEGTVPSWVTVPAANIPGDDKLATVHEFSVGLDSGVVGGPAASQAAVYLTQAFAIPLGTVVTVSVNWSYYRSAAANSRFGILGNTTGTWTSAGTSGSEASVITTAGSAGLVGPYTHTFTHTINNTLMFPETTPRNAIGVTPAVETYAAPSDNIYTQVNFFTISWEESIQLTRVEVSNTPSISFVGQAPTVVGVQSVLQVPLNVPTVSFATFSSTISTNGGIAIGVDHRTIAFVGYEPTVTAIRIATQVITNVPELLYIGFDATARINNNVLSFVFIDKTDTNFTARDAAIVSSLDMGAILYNEEKIVGIRLGNTSSIPTTFTITATSANNLATMVTFSIDRVTYSESLLIESVLSNGITDTIWIKLSATTSSYIDAGTFLIHVEQIDA